MSAKAKLLLTLLLLVVWVTGSGMSVFSTPLVVSGPQLVVNDVIRNKSVQFTLLNFQPDVSVEVLIGAYGTKGVNGIRVGMYTTSHSGALTATVSIPRAFKGVNRLDLRVQRKGYHGSSNPSDYAFVSFLNRTSAATTPQKSIMVQVIQVDPRVSVTVKFDHLPANLRFNVRMLGVGGKEVGSVQIGSFDTGSGAPLVITYRIPRAIARSQLIILTATSTTQNYIGTTLFFN